GVETVHPLRRPCGRPQRITPRAAGIIPVPPSDGAVRPTTARCQRRATDVGHRRTMTTNLDTAHRTALPVAGAATAVLAVVQGVFGSVGVLIESLAAAHATDRGLLVLLFPAALAVHTLVARYAGRAADRFGPRPLLVAAACGMAVGLLTPALAAAPHAVIAGYGIGLGVASACTWVATATAVGTAFRGRAATAMGVLTAGPAAGGAVLAP